uniref:Uncharacterized protein n=1 Tax=Anopheles dirus TaxID=7168 RepID=A0A182NIS8_9DIPT
MDCCSSSNYVDYRHHSMSGNFCYPYTPSMLRSASPYPLGAGGGRYGSDYRSSPLGGYHHVGGPGAGYEGGYEKYYGGYHHAASGYQGGYYGNYPSSYRDYGGYGHYYGHQSQSPYARGSGGGGAGAPPPGYPGGSSTGGPGGYLYPGRHYPAHPFGSREAYYHAAQREHHQQQYSNFASYSHLQPSPYRSGIGPGEHTGSKSHHHQQHQHHQQQQYPPQPSFAGSHTERGMTGSVGSDGSASTGHPSPSSASLYSAPNGYSSPSSDYTAGLPASSSYGAQADSPQHPLTAAGGSHHDAAEERNAPTPTTPLLSGATEFPHGTKDTRMRRPKERKLHRGSRTSSPTTGPPANGLSGNSGAAQRMKSLDALTNLCWPEEDHFPGRMRKYSNGLKSKETANSKKESNELEATGTASPSRVGTGPGRRTKKQTAGSSSSKQSKEAKANESREKQTNGATAPAAATATPPVENKNITPLPGFQQAFGSTEIGKFSEVFFNSSPTSSDHSPPHHHHHHHALQLQEQQQQHHHHHHQGQQSQPIPSQSMQQLVMDTLNAYESDVDTLSPQPWEPAHGGEPYDSGGTNGGAGYNLQIGTTFHPSYYESSSYSDHAVDSPLGNYFSEMTCSEFVN